jgi:hypothetical protein
VTVKKMFQGKAATPDRASTSGGVTEHRSGSHRPLPKAPKRESGAGRVSFGGGAMSRPIRGGKIKRY